MKLKDLFEMARQYGLDQEAALIVRPLAKDTPRKVTGVELGGNGEIVFVCNRTAPAKTRRRIR